MSETRIAMVGAGWFGQFHYDAWSRIDGCRLVALAAPEGGGGPETADRWDVPAVFADPVAMVRAAAPDLVDIVAPPATHLELIRALAGQVAMIVCQKPFCGGLERAREATALAAAAGTRLVVHENVRFQRWYREIRDLLAVGLIGDPWQIAFRLRPGDGQGPAAYLDRQPYFQRMARFLVHETAIHWVDTFRFLMGEVVSVSADLRRLNPAIAGEDAGVLQFAFGSGARGLFDANRLADHAATDRRRTMGEMEIEGPDGTLRLDGQAQIWHRAHGSDQSGRIAFDWTDRNFGGDCVHATCRSIVDALRDGVSAEGEAADYLRNLEIEEALYRSQAERRWVDV